MSHSGDPSVLVWIDVSTLFRSHFVSGLIRVQASLIRELTLLCPERIRFCRAVGGLAFVEVKAALVSNRLELIAEGRVFAARTDLQKCVHRWVTRYAAPESQRLWHARLSMFFWRAEILREAVLLFLRRLPTAKFSKSEVLLTLSEHWKISPRLVKSAQRRGICFVPLVHDLLRITSGDSPLALVRSSAEATHELLSRADLILTSSQFNRQEIRDFARARGFECPPVEVLPFGSDLPLHEATPPASFRGASGGEGSFVLYVSTLDPRKNHAFVWNLWKRLHSEREGVLPTLVFAGRAGSATAPAFLDEIQKESGPSARCEWLPRLKDSEIRWLYESCLFTVYPSLREGWGLPVAESLAYGKLCIASNTTALPEVGAGLAWHFDPRDEEAWKTAIARLLDDPAELERQGLRIRSDYVQPSWRSCAELMISKIGSL